MFCSESWNALCCTLLMPLNWSCVATRRPTLYGTNAPEDACGFESFKDPCVPALPPTSPYEAICASVTERFHLYPVIIFAMGCKTSTIFIRNHVVWRGIYITIVSRVINGKTLLSWIMNISCLCKLCFGQSTKFSRPFMLVYRSIRLSGLPFTTINRRYPWLRDNIYNMLWNQYLENFIVNENVPHLIGCYMRGADKNRVYEEY
jgi:hypothetical protein